MNNAAATTKSTYKMTVSANGRVIRREILPAPRRFLGKCRCCKRPLSALVSELIDAGRAGIFALTETAAIEYTNGILEMPCNACGAVSNVRRVLGKFSPRHVCNAKCLASTSGHCECSCGGKNHGASHAA